nr:IS1 family transposase [Endozoicomonas montiporae]
MVKVNPNIQTIDLKSDAIIHVGLVCQEAELDEQWSYVHDKSNQRWLWYAVDHATNTVLAYVFGKRKDEVFKELKTLLKPIIGKANTQKIERKNLNFRTWIKRLARKTICFSKLEKMHDIVIGLLINKVEFGVNIHAI